MTGNQYKCPPYPATWARMQEGPRVLQFLWTSGRHLDESQGPANPIGRHRLGDGQRGCRRDPQRRQGHPQGAFGLVALKQLDYIPVAVIRGEIHARCRRRHHEVKCWRREPVRLNHFCISFRGGEHQGRPLLNVVDRVRVRAASSRARRLQDWGHWRRKSAPYVGWHRVCRCRPCALASPGQWSRDR